MNYHSSIRKICVLPKAHKPEIPFRLVISGIGSDPHNITHSITTHTHTHTHIYINIYIYIYKRWVKKVSCLKLYLSSQKRAMNEKLIFIKLLASWLSTDLFHRFFSPFHWSKHLLNEAVVCLKMSSISLNFHV